MKLRNSYIAGILFCLLTTLPAAQNDQAPEFIEGRYFEIIGRDIRSVSFTNTLGEHIAGVLNRCLTAGSHEFPQPVVVVLQPEKDVEFEGGYQIKAGARGKVSLYLCWNTSLRLETLCRALTEAYLTRYAIFNYGPGAGQKIRFWTVSALSSWSYLNLRPAQKAAYILEAREHGVSEIVSLLTLDLESGRRDERLLRQGYWILSTLRQNGFGYSNISAMLEQAIMGADVTVKFKSLVEPANSEEGAKFILEDWWQHQIEITLSQDQEYCDSLKISQIWIKDLADFEEYNHSGVRLKNLMELWKYRNDETVRSVLEARSEVIRLRIERVNPAYFNAALALGTLFETALESDHKHKFIHALTVYLSDWADTKQLHDKTFELLSEGPILN